MKEIKDNDFRNGIIFMIILLCIVVFSIYIIVKPEPLNSNIENWIDKIVIFNK